MKKIEILVIIIILIFQTFCFADIVYLNSGKKIEGEIIEQTQDYVKINMMGMGFYVTYQTEDIKEIKKTENKAYIPNSSNNDLSQPMQNLVEQIEAQTIDQESYLLYIPSNIHKEKKYPLVIALHPGGHAPAMIETWKNIAEEHKWIVFASKTFRNGASNWNEPIYEALEEVFMKYPINKRKIISTGISGGGMGAHMLSYSSLNLVSAVIANVGRIHPNYKKAPAKNDYPRKKIAVFLASPTDFNYEHMKDDRNFLRDLGWDVKWIEFEGGHVTAPEHAYQEAAAWLDRYL
ncbi:MAG: hypothetical protein ABII88_07675 [Candidatus Omnitrophota bacterium]